MTPSEYEALVAEHYVGQGFTVDDRPATNDWGIDIIATKGAERVGVQVKMYGGTARPVNRAQVMELFGAAAYFDCTRAVIATDGRVMSDAEAVAKKLSIEILRIDSRGASWSRRPDESKKSDFDRLWELHIMPLAGRTLSRTNGDSNTILTVDWSGVERITSNGARQRIKIEIFRLAVQRVLAEGSISRDEISAHYPGRASSGIVLILAQIPDFEYASGILRKRL